MQQSAKAIVCPRGNQYIVQKGDTLAAIANQFTINIGDLLQANPGLDASAVLMPGDAICVPGYDPVYDGTANDNFFVSTGTPVVTGPSQPSAPVVTLPTQPSTPGINITIQPGVTTYTCPSGYSAGIIAPGQTYADLLIANNVSYQAMQQANPTLNPSRLVSGTTYCAPPAGARQSCARYRTYRMQEGETLAMAAQRLGTTPGRLLMLNPHMVPTDFTAGALICAP